MARFLGKSPSEDQLEKLTRHLTFENLSQNAAVNKEDGKLSGNFHENGKFMRKGDLVLRLVYSPANLLCNGSQPNVIR